MSGMDYAIITGADIGPLGNQAVTELSDTFNWAEKNTKGMILFVDEADAFLRRRETGANISEQMRNCINAFLYKTGTPSDKFMLILATNMPHQLDDAIFDRIDELVYFDKPRIQERVNLLYLYLLQYCNPPQSFYQKALFFLKHPKSIISGKKLISMKDIDNAFIETIAEKTEGFSGREIAKMVVSWHDAAFALENPILTPGLMLSLLDKHIKMHDIKVNWGEKEAAIFSKFQSTMLSNKEQSMKSKNPDPEQILRTTKQLNDDLK